jgi:hypothetical protein
MFEDLTQYIKTFQNYPLRRSIIIEIVENKGH